MNWPLASFMVIAVVLLVGWFAYERSRPSARTVALVATLSALAALGRDAFAALSDVKPITAMTFVVGYSLGPLPGFTVGAIGMLASNFVLGQGSWTPWQMAAWGIVGLLGAIAGRLTRGRLRRLPLALGCAFAALVAKEIMNLYGWATGASHTAAALLIEVTKGLPFDVVDVVSTLLFGLAFGPELARLLNRMRARTQVEWRPVGSGLAVMFALALSLSASATSTRAARAEIPVGKASTRSTLARGLAYLASAQKQDGGFGQQAGAPSTGLFTGWTAIGIAATGRRPLSMQSGGHTVIDALGAGAEALAGVGAIERTILALHACGVPAGQFEGLDLRAELESYRKPDGSFADEANHTAFAIFALRALGDRRGDPEIQAASRWLSAQQNADGGFSFGMRGDPSDVDDTGAALQALAIAKTASRHAISRAVVYLMGSENRDGGFPQQRGEEPNAMSTAWALQGLIAVGQPPREGSRSPSAYLRRMVAANGSVRYSSESEQTPVWVTSEVLTALAGATFPVAPPDPRNGAPAVMAGVGVFSASALIALSGLVAR
jgi:uncharacterized membrane protein